LRKLTAYVVIVGLSSGSTRNHDKPKELKMAENQRKSKRATLYGALAQVSRDSLNNV
jgi:high-affinity Fe2+/Pb2+ permease